MKESIQQAREAGITIFMITGDNENTALAISKELGMVPEDTTLIQENKVVFKGSELPMENSKKTNSRMNMCDLTSVIRSSVGM